MGSFSHANETLEKLLAVAYPQYKVKRIDLRDKLSPLDRIINGFTALREYGMDIVSRKRSLKDCMEHTTYFLETTRKIAHRSFPTDELAFTFQTQSMFDASREGIPHFLYTDHTHLANLGYPSFNETKLFPIWWREYERRMYHHADCNFTMSERIARSVREDYRCPASKVECVYAGCNLLPSSTTMLRNRPRGKHILFVGLDWERKGGPVLLEAFKRVLVSHPDAVLSIVGCVRPSPHPNCKFVGQLPLDEVCEYYRSATVFCMPTRIEPFGHVFIEAMAHGLPVVGTKIGAIPELIQEGVNGYLVEPDDPTSLAQALCAVLDDPERASAMGENGRLMVNARFTWDAVMALIKNRIDLVLNQKSAAV